MPKPDPASILAEKLLQTLRKQRQLGMAPLTVSRLAALADPTGASDLVLRALAKSRMPVSSCVPAKSTPIPPLPWPRTATGSSPAPWFSISPSSSFAAPRPRCTL